MNKPQREKWKSWTNEHMKSLVHNFKTHIRNNINSVYHTKRILIMQYWTSLTWTQHNRASGKQTSLNT